MPALASPCDERDVFLEDEFAALAASLYQQGVHGVYVCGATGDCHSMRLQERKRATELAVEVSRKFGGMALAHVGTSNTRDSVELAEHAATVGASAVASMPPSNRSHAQLLSYYTDITQAAQIPVLIYHIPALTGQTLSVDEMARLLDIEGVMGLKFSDYNLFFMKQLLLARPDIVVLNGNDEILCPSLLYGARGGIGLTYNLFPNLFINLYRATSEGNIGRAIELQNVFIAFLDRAVRWGIFQVLDYLLKERGFGPCFYRRPRLVLDAEAGRRFTAEMRPLIAAIEAACV